MNNIEIKTPAGRTIAFTSSAAQNIEEAGLTGQIDDDINVLIAGGTVAALISHCQDGADQDRMEGWDDYCAAILRTADNEMLTAQPTGRPW